MLPEESGTDFALMAFVTVWSPFVVIIEPVIADWLPIRLVTGILITDSKRNRKRQ